MNRLEELRRKAGLTQAQLAEKSGVATSTISRFEVVGLPGHTKCSVGFYMRENRLLLGTETLGVYLGDGVYLPSYLVGYQMTMDSFARARALEIDSLLILDIKEEQYFTTRGFTDQHLGGQAFAKDESIMGWLFGAH